MPMMDGPYPVGATLVVARAGQSNAVHHTKTGDHKGRPYDHGSLAKSERLRARPQRSLVRPMLRHHLLVQLQAQPRRRWWGDEALFEADGVQEDVAVEGVAVVFLNEEVGR